MPIPTPDQLKRVCHGGPDCPFTQLQETVLDDPGMGALRSCDGSAIVYRKGVREREGLPREVIRGTQYEWAAWMSAGDALRTGESLQYVRLHGGTSTLKVYVTTLQKWVQVVHVGIRCRQSGLHLVYTHIEHTTKP